MVLVFGPTPVFVPTDGMDQHVTCLFVHLDVLMECVPSQMCVPVTVAGLALLVRQKLSLILVVALSLDQVFTT